MISEFEEFINSLDGASFICGYIFCMFAEVFFSVANFFTQKAFEVEHRRKSKKNHNLEVGSAAGASVSDIKTHAKLQSEPRNKFF